MAWNRRESKKSHLLILGSWSNKNIFSKKSPHKNRKLHIKRCIPLTKNYIHKIGKQYIRPLSNFQHYTTINPISWDFVPPLNRIRITLCGFRELGEDIVNDLIIANMKSSNIEMELLSKKCNPIQLSNYATNQLIPQNRKRPRGRLKINTTLKWNHLVKELYRRQWPIIGIAQTTTNQMVHQVLAKHKVHTEGTDFTSNTGHRRSTNFCILPPTDCKTSECTLPISWPRNGNSKKAIHVNPNSTNIETLPVVFNKNPATFMQTCEISQAVTTTAGSSID